MRTHFIVLWRVPGWRQAYQGDIYADTARDARERFKVLFAADHVIGVKRARGGRGRFEA